MSLEIEYKFTLEESYVEALLKHPLLAKQIERQAQTIKTLYYDTPMHDLKAKGMALRVRQVNGDFVQTVKGGGSQEGALHTRQEWEVPISGWLFELDKIVPEAAEILLENLDPKALLPMFTTDFTRYSWEICLEDETCIELAYDVGTVSANDKTQKLAEIEIELLSGDVNTLTQVVQRLQKDLPLQPQEKSKAAQAYDLLAAQ